MVSSNVRKYLKTIGQKGGKERAKKLSSEVLSAQAQRAVMTRWIRRRFGVDSFKDLGLPGWEIIDLGLRDLVEGNTNSVNALVVLELRPRLRFLGVPVPKILDHISNIRILIYNKMKEEHRGMVYVRFCALLERADSFCDSLMSLYPIPKISPHRHRRWYA